VVFSIRGDDEVTNSLPDRPLLVSAPKARKLIGCGPTKFWALVKAGKIKMVDVGVGNRMVDYSSLETLAKPNV
jgi:hypothetical protein